MLAELQALSQRTVTEIFNAGDLERLAELFHLQYYAQQPVGWRDQ